MAEGGADLPGTNLGGDNEGYDPNDDNENTGLLDREKEEEERRRWQERYSPRRAESGREEEVGMKHREHLPPGYGPKTSTSKEGEQETSFIDTPSGEDIFASREQAREELNKEIHDVFPYIDKKLLPHIRRDDYGQLIVNLGKRSKDGSKLVSKDWPIAYGGRPSHDYGLKKFPAGLRKGLGRTNIQINEHAQEVQRIEEEKQAKREQELEQSRRARAENDEKLEDAEERKENLEQVVKEQKEAEEYSLSTKDKESYSRSGEASRNALRQVGAEVEELRVERDRLERAERNAEEGVQEGERQVETARERVNQRLLSLRDRIKEIFKKHGFTVIAVATAIATVIGVIVSSLRAGLAKVAKGVGNGLKELGAKLGQILPGMVGAIASFIFKTAGQVIGFLAEHAWLLVVGLVVLAVEQFKKKSK